MNLEITARHLRVGADLKAHVRDRLEHVLRHVDGDVTSAHVILTKERASHGAELVVHGKGLNTAVKAEGDDLFQAVDLAADKLKHQLERTHSRRLVGRRKGGTRLSVAEAALAAEMEALMTDAIERGPRSRAGKRLAKEAAEAPPAFVRMRPSRLKTMSVEQAITKLTEDETGFLVFKSASGEACILHRLSDGTLGLIESGIE